MPKCIYCEAENADRNYFCTSCHKQFRCKVCGESLEPNAGICGACGHAIGQFPIANSAVNKIDFSEESTDGQGGSSKRKASAQFTDVAMESTAYLVLSLMNNSGGLGRIKPQQNKLTVDQAPQLPPIIQDVDSNHTDESLNNKFGNLQTSNANIFAVDGDTIISLVSDLKGETSKEQQVRFIVLFIQEYQTSFSEKPSLDKISLSARKSNFYDRSNFSKYLEPTIKSYFSDLSDRYAINPKGQNYSKQILEDLKNDDKQGFDMSASGSKSASGIKRVRTPFGTPEKQSLKEIVDAIPEIQRLDSRQRHIKEVAAIILYLAKTKINRDDLNTKVLHELMKKTIGYSASYSTTMDSLKRRSKDYVGFKSNNHIFLTQTGDDYGKANMPT